MVRCDRCGEETPPLEYCVRCGNRLAAVSPGRGIRAEYAAAPHERLIGVHVASTIFPQLPRADMESFRVGLMIAVSAIVILAALGQFPAALAVAAVAVPFLVAIYLYDVDIYEDEPLRVIAFTMGWGAVSGILAALMIRSLQPGGAATAAGLSTTYLLEFGVVVPLVGFAIILAGPLALLRYPKFNDVLDGTTFGVTSAVSFLGAGALVAAFDLTRAGNAPPGETLPRIVLLLSTGIALPLLAAGVTGAALGTVWMRTRSSLRHERHLGILGNPFVAVAVAAAIFVVAALSGLVLSALTELIVLVALAACRSHLAPLRDPHRAAGRSGRAGDRATHQVRELRTDDPAAHILRFLRGRSAGAPEADRATDRCESVG